jgi:hypothetical protein
MVVSATVLSFWTRELYIRRAAARGKSAGFEGLAAEVGEEPEEEGKRGAKNEASDDGEIESGVFAARDDVAGEFAEAERESSTEVK